MSLAGKCDRPEDAESSGLSFSVNVFQTRRAYASTLADTIYLMNNISW